MGTVPFSGRRRRVTFVLPSLAGGGAERAAVQILNALGDHGWDRELYLFAREGPYLGEVDPSVSIASGARRSRIGRWLDLRRHVRATRPDVVMAFLSYVTALTATRAAGVGARVVFNQQTPFSAFLGDVDYAWRRPGLRQLFLVAARLGYRAADMVVATSRGVADDLVGRLGVVASRVRVIANPVDLDGVRAAAGAPLDPAVDAAWPRPRIVAAGRLADVKNYPLLIDALARVRERIPATLAILGQGDEEAALRALVAARGLNDAVVFCGFESNPWRYMARADVFALTSRYEGFGNVLVEAMACGTPVVATASPGTRDIVENAVNGRLIEAHIPEAVADALVAVLRDDALRTRLSAGARESAERYAPSLVSQAYAAALEGGLV